MGFRVEGTGNSEFKFNNVTQARRAEELPNSIIDVTPKKLDKVTLSNPVGATETELRVSSLAANMDKLSDDVGYKGYSYLSPVAEERLPEFVLGMADLMDGPEPDMPTPWELENDPGFGFMA